MFRLSTKSIVILSALCFTGLIGLQVAWLRSAYEGELALYTKEKRQFETELQHHLKEDSVFKKHLRSLLDAYNSKQELPSIQQTQFINYFDEVLNQFFKEKSYTVRPDNFSILQHRFNEIKVLKENHFVLAKNSIEPGSLSNAGKVCLHCILGMGAGNHDQYNYQLVLFYDKERSIIYSRLGWLIAGSFLLILLLGVLFRQMLKRYQQERRLSEAKNDFINNLSHEMQTPVFAVQMANSLIKEKVINLNEIDPFTTIIEKETHQLKEHASKILELASLENEQIELNKQRTELNEFIEGRRGTMELMLYKKGGSLKIHNHPGPLYVSIDRVHFNNLLVSLVDNAIKYNDKTPEIILATTMKGNQIHFCVSDNGIGIGQQYLPYVFEKFYRVPDVKRNGFSGFGLGLSYVRHIVKLHGGEIAIKSKHQEGTNVYIILPNETGNV